MADGSLATEANATTWLASIAETLVAPLRGSSVKPNAGENKKMLKAGIKLFNINHLDDGGSRSATYARSVANGVMGAHQGKFLEMPRGTTLPRKMTHKIIDRRPDGDIDRYVNLRSE